MNATQEQLLLTELRHRGAAGITPLQALDAIGSLRLAAVVHRLRGQGFTITTEPYTTPTGKHVARYVLHEPRAHHQEALPW